MKIDPNIEDSIFDSLMCREIKSFRRSLHGPKGKKIRREARLSARRMSKMIRKAER